MSDQSEIYWKDLAAHLSKYMDGLNQLSRRDLFAGLAMAGNIAGGWSFDNPNQLVSESVMYADALIKALALEEDHE